MSQLYVGNLQRDDSEDVLRCVFSEFGRIERVRLFSGPTDYAFIDFEDPEDAEDAICLFDRELHGWRVDLSHYSKAFGLAMEEAVGVLVVLVGDAIIVVSPGNLLVTAAVMVREDDIAVVQVMMQDATACHLIAVAVAGGFIFSLDLCQKHKEELEDALLRLTAMTEERDRYKKTHESLWLELNFEWRALS